MALSARSTSAASATDLSATTDTAAKSVRNFYPFQIERTTHVYVLGPGPRKRPKLRTKYTRFPSPSEEPARGESAAVGAASSEAPGETREREERGREGGERRETGEGEKRVDGVETGQREESEGGEGVPEKVFSFYGAGGSGSGEEPVEDGAGGSGSGEGPVEDGADITDDQPGAEVELPYYAPDVCAETVVGTEKFSENEVKEPEAESEVEPPPIEIAEIAVETEQALPTADDVTEADIFGGSSDDDVPDREEEAEGEGQIEKDEREGQVGREKDEQMEGQRDEGERQRDEGEGQMEGERDEGEGQMGGEKESLKEEFQQAIQTSQTTSKSLSLLLNQTN